MRRVLVALLLGLPLSCSPEDHGLFRGLEMTETDVLCRHEYSTCWVRIERRATGRLSTPGEATAGSGSAGASWKNAPPVPLGQRAKDWERHGGSGADGQRPPRDLQRDEVNAGPAVLPRSVRAAASEEKP